MNRVCQIVLVFFAVALGLGGCASVPERAIYKAKPTWFNLRKSIGLRSWTGETQTHLFYDAVPDLNLSTAQVNFIPTSLANTDKAYGLDPLSGQRYFSHFYCGQDDVWQERGSTPRRPTFTRGVVPRHYDQLHGPQQIIVFGHTRGYDLKKAEAYRVRVVGGVVEQICRTGRCGGINEWSVRLVLVAVNEYDRDFRHVKTIRELQKEVNWRKVQNELENHEGRNFIAEDKYAPAIRVGNLVEAKEVMEYMIKRSVILNSKELSDLSRQCAKLYSRIWKQAGLFSYIKRPSDKVEDVKRSLKANQELRKRTHFNSFHQALTHFFRDEPEAVAACTRLVYPGNQSVSPEKFWFNSWVTMYVRMHMEGFKFNCSSKTWSTIQDKAEAMEYLKEASSNCGDSSFDMAMRTLPDFLRRLPTISGDYWRFVEWDNTVYGTHDKLYSWIKVPARDFGCGDNDETNKKVRSEWAQAPEGESWRPRRKEGVDRYDEYID